MTELLSYYAGVMPKRYARSHKGVYGSLAIMAGSYGMAGAAVLCARSAYRIGTGLVYVASPECNRLIIQTAVPEAIYTECGDVENVFKIFDKITAFVAGPGFGTRRQQQRIMRWMMANITRPGVIDADGLNMISEDPAMLLNEDKRMSREETPRLIFTPHFGEASRLTGNSIEEIMSDPVETAKQCARKYGVICVLKDHRTVISDGKNVWKNPTGCSGMAVAGSGDVLAGMIGGLLAQGVKPVDAARLGVYLHGRAGELASQELGEHSMLSSDIEKYIGTAIRELILTSEQ